MIIELYETSLTVSFSSAWINPKGNWQHSELQDYLTKTYAVLKNHNIYESFFEFNTPHFSDLGEAFFQRIQQEYYFGEDVVAAIKAVFREHPEDYPLLDGKMSHMAFLSVTN